MDIVYCMKVMCESIFSSIGGSLGGLLDYAKPFIDVIT